MAEVSDGPARVVLTASVARRYYLDGRSKVEIAEEFGLSRFKVARLLDAARESGLVRIEIRHQGEIDVDLSARLQDRFGLQHSVVVDTPDDDAARALRGQPEVARAFAQLPLVTKAVAGVGLWKPGQSTLYDALSEDDRTALHRLGVCADVSGVFLSADGEAIGTELSERMIGINAEQMRAIPEVIVIPYGVAKAPAVRAALRSGLVGGIVTHTALAHAVLEE